MLFETEGKRELTDAMQLVRMLGNTARSREFQDASARYWGHQYAGLEEWTEDVPLREKKPSVNVRLTKTAIDAVNTRLFGEDKRPSFNVEALAEFDVAGDAQFDEDGNPVDEALATNLERARSELQTVIRECRIRRHYSEIGRIGLLHGTLALAFHQLESGRIWCEIITVADSHVTLAGEDRARADEMGLDDDDVLELDEYWRTVDEDPATGDETYWIHRRQWTIEETIEFEPIDESTIRTPADIVWTVDEGRTVQHNLGFVPVVWHRSIRVANDKFGAPLLEPAEYSIEDEFNYTLSQTGRGIRYNQEPTPVFSNAGNVGGDRSLVTGGNKSIVLESMGSGMPPADAKLLEMTGAGQAAAFEYLDRLRKLFYEVASVVVHDPEEFGGVMSGVALKMLLLPLVAKVSQLRETYGDTLTRFFELALRARGYDVRVSVTWPDVVELMPSDVGAIVAPLQMAYQNNFVTLETVVETLAPIYGIDDVQQYLADLAVESGASTPRDIDPDTANRRLFSDAALERARQRLSGAQGDEDDGEG